MMLSEKEIKEILSLVRKRRKRTRRVRVNGKTYKSPRKAYEALFPERKGQIRKWDVELEYLAKKGLIELEWLD